MKFKFECVSHNRREGNEGDPVVSAEYIGEYLSDVRDRFDEFLRGCGYVVPYDMPSVDAIEARRELAMERQDNQLMRHMLTRIGEETDVAVIHNVAEETLDAVTDFPDDD